MCKSRKGLYGLLADMTAVLSSTDGESSDVEVVYEEPSLSLQSKLRNELQMLEALRDSHDPIPVNYNAFKEYVASLKYTFCQEVIDGVWSKLKDVMILEKEGKLGSNFNRHSLCGRDNCVCGQEEPIIELVSSDSESDCCHSATETYRKVQTTVFSTSVKEGCSYQHESTATSSNCNGCDSADVYSKSCAESVTVYEEEVKTQEQTTKRSKVESVDISGSDSHAESHSKHSKSKSKENSELIKTVDYSHRKRRYCENSSQYSSTKKQTHTSDDIIFPDKELDSNNKTVDSTEVHSDSDTLYNIKKKKQKESVRENTDNENDVSKKDYLGKEDKHVNINEVHRTDTFEHKRSSSSSSNKNASNTTNEKGRTRKSENENITSGFHNDSCELVEDTKSECSITSSKSVNNEYKKHKKNISVNDGYNKKHKVKVKDRSWSENLSGITKHVCELLENDIKEDNCDKTSGKIDNRRKKQQPHLYSTTNFRRNAKEQSVVIDAHIQIVHSSKNEGKKKDSGERSNDSVSNNESPKKTNTSSKKTQKIDEKNNRNSNRISKAKLKKFIEIENKKRRKEKEKIINHEWQLIHDRLVQLMVPKIFEGNNINNS